MLTSILTFAGAACLIAMVPGPSTAVILRRSVLHGRTSGMVTVLGNEAGVLLWGLAAAFGLSAVLVASEIAYHVMRIAGAAFLIWMGAQALWRARRGNTADEEADDGRVSHWRAFRLGLLTNAANPKAGVFAVSLLPQFAPSGAPVLPMLLVFSVMWALIDLIWYFGLVWLAGRVRATFQRPAVRRRMEQVSGTVLVTLGVRLAAQP
ncbi:LysE family translocator [Uniformispora flossi]|uniref:LysE family translocator n=1 Tax=Uniformispora flossi TaxID=3390723 RepID=UPI003C2E683E